MKNSQNSSDDDDVPSGLDIWKIIISHGKGVPTETLHRLVHERRNRMTSDQYGLVLV